MAEEGTGVNPPMEEETSGNLFCAPVGEKQLVEAGQRSLRRIFGSSRTFLSLDIRAHGSDCSYEDVVEEKMAEHYECGLRCLSREEWEAAVVSFTKAINLRPEKTELYVKRAEAFLQLCDFQSAALNLQRASSSPDPCAEHLELLAAVYYLQGQSLFDQTSYTDAMESFTQAAELQPQNRHYHMRSILCLAALGRYSECLRLISKRLEEAQGDPDLYMVRARLYHHLNEAALTYQDIQRVLSLDPRHPQALKLKDTLAAKAEEAKDRAVNYTLQRQLQDALRKICSAIENNPSSARYHIIRGSVFRKMREFSPAVEDFVRAMQLCNTESDFQLYTEAGSQLVLTYNDLAVHCYLSGFYQEGATLLSRAIKRETGRKELYVNRGDCFLQLGDPTFALADYQQALDLDEADWGVRTRIARLLDDLGSQAQHQRHYQQAERHFSEAIQCNPLLPQPYLHRAQVRRLINVNSQEDVVTFMILSPTSPEVSPALTNFFPGNTPEEVMSSRLSTRASNQLEEILKELPTRGQHSGTSAEAGSGIPPQAGRDFAACVSDRELREMVQSQRQLRKDVRAALTRRGRLQTTPSQIIRPPKPPEEGPRPQAPYHWKTFGLGLTNPG